MMTHCPIHGLTSALRCSQDVHPSTDGARELHDIVDLVYHIEGWAVWAYYVSREFARKHNLVAGVYLDEEPGDWHKELWGSCADCFEAAHAGYIDEQHRWRAGPRLE